MSSEGNDWCLGVYVFAAHHGHLSQTAKLDHVVIGIPDIFSSRAHMPRADLTSNSAALRPAAPTCHENTRNRCKGALYIPERKYVPRGKQEYESACGKQETG
eukprot:2935160-Amphidinium_carterae.1